MKDTKTLLQVLLAGYTWPQKRNFLRYFFSQGGPVAAYQPITLSIVATGRCTLACDMCPTHSRLVPADYEHTQKTKTDMEFEMFRDIIDRFDKALAVHIIGSGEPLLNKDLFRMIEYAARKRMLVKTISNGTLLSEDGVMEKILASRLEGITISINGHNRDEFSRMTGMKSAVFDDIRRNISELIRKKRKTGSRVKVKLSFILDSVNIHALDAMITLALELGADHTFFCNFLPAPFDGLRPEERVLFDDAHLPVLRAAYRRLRRGQTKRFTFPPLLKRGMKIMKCCDSHFSQMRVDGGGNVSSCSMMLLNMENKGKYSDRDAWNNEFFQMMRRRFIDTQAPLPDPCYHCTSNFGIRLQS